MRKTGKFLLVVIVLCLCASNSKAIVFSDGELHEIDWATDEFVEIHPSYTGEPTIVNVVSGGIVDSVYIYGNCELLVSGGIVSRFVFVEGSNSRIAVSDGRIGDYIYVRAVYETRIDISGGTIGGYIYAEETWIDISGGIIGGYIYAKNDSRIYISGGTIGSYVFASYGTHLFITGGTIDDYVACAHDCQGTILGGTFGSLLQVDYGSVVSIYGANFNYSYGRIPVSSGVLTGALASGVPINNGFDINHGASILLIHQPPHPHGDECADANSIEKGIVYTGSTEDATGSKVSSCGNNDTNDVWLSYTATEDGYHVFSLCDSDFDTTLSIFDKCEGTELACDDNACGLQSKIALSLTADHTYLIRIAGNNDETGYYLIAVNSPECLAKIEGDLTGDCRLDFKDFAMMALNWLKCNLDPPEACWE